MSDLPYNEEVELIVAEYFNEYINRLGCER